MGSFGSCGGTAVTRQGYHHPMVHVTLPVCVLIFGKGCLCWKGGWRPPCMVAVGEPLNCGVGTSPPGGACRHPSESMLEGREATPLHGNGGGAVESWDRDVVTGWCVSSPV